MSATPLRMLLTDRRRPQAIEHLRGWLGAESAARVSDMTPAVLRYVLIVSSETGLADPKYIHAVELMPDLAQLGERLLSAVRVADECVTTANPIPIDIRFGLEPAERDSLNLLLDEHERHRLLHAREQGHG